MRAGALAVGVFLLVIGVVVFWIGYSDLQQYGGFSVHKSSVTY